MLIAAATTGPSVLWYLARGTGAVALLLLSASVVLGILGVRRLSSPRLPRFVVDGLHRSVSLLVLALLALHIACSVLDGFVDISLVSALVPFASSYRPVWLGLGSVAFELLAALAVTSLLRQRIGYRAWRAVHWLAYACWPLALVHGFGTGTDGRTSWMLALSGVCVVAVVLAILVRVASGSPADRRRRIAAGAVAALSPLLLLAWLLDGPLASGWARRAGTPVVLLSSPAPSPVVAAAGVLRLPFTARVSGRLTEATTPLGVAVDISLADARGRVLAIRIVGQPSPGGGVAMTGSTVRLGTTARPGVYRGRLVGLTGGDLTASLTDGTHRARLDAALRIAGATVAGRTTVSPAA